MIKSVFIYAVTYMLYEKQKTTYVCAACVAEAVSIIEEKVGNDGYLLPNRSLRIIHIQECKIKPIIEI